MTPLPAQLIANYSDRNRAYCVAVHDGERTVTCRLQPHRNPGRWKCSACGRLDGADCLHAFSAALMLAEQVLGLARADSLRTDERTSA